MTRPTDTDYKNRRGRNAFVFTSATRMEINLVGIGAGGLSHFGVIIRFS